MRDIDAGIVAQLQAGELKPFLLLDVEIDGTDYRYTDCDVPLVVGGNSYSPRGARLEAARYSLNTVVDSIRIELDNLDDALTAAFVAGTPQGGEVILKQAILDANNEPMLNQVTWFHGEIDEWGLDEEKVTFTVTSELVKWNQQTLAKHSATCRWRKFKGTRCAYAGAETWCDRTYVRCVALANQVNFGGFRFLPSLMDREIWWGKSRAV